MTECVESIIRLAFTDRKVDLPGLNELVLVFVISSFGSVHLADHIRSLRHAVLRATVFFDRVVLMTVVFVAALIQDRVWRDRTCHVRVVHLWHVLPVRHGARRDHVELGSISVGLDNLVVDGVRTRIFLVLRVRSRSGLNFRGSNSVEPVLQIYNFRVILHWLRLLNIFLSL